MSKPIVSLKGRALRYLSQREHSRDELRRKLRPIASQLGESEAQLDLLLEQLQAQNFLSDARYAEARLRSRNNRYGNQRLVQELSAKGVEDASGYVNALPDEIERIIALMQGKELPIERDEQAKWARRLQLKGFSYDSIRRALRQLRENENDSSVGRVAD